MSALRIWLMAARPRTLPAAIAPVLSAAPRPCGQQGSAPATRFRWGTFIAALIGAIFIQIGTNLANDYSDAKRGADTVDRLGPVRVTAAGLAARAACSSRPGSPSASPRWPASTSRSRSGPRSSLSASLSIVAGVLYTGGPRPYGYEGLGEVFVFVFFGLVAVNGSYYVQLEELDLRCRSCSRSRSGCSPPRSSSSTTSATSTPTAAPASARWRCGSAASAAARSTSAMIAASYALLPLALLVGDGPALGAARPAQRCRWPLKPIARGPRTAPTAPR